jgi:hypothetical protein
MSNRGQNSEILHIWKVYLTLGIVKQDKCPKYNGSSHYSFQHITVSNILLCPTYYCVQQFTVKQNTMFTHALYILLFNFPLTTCCGRIKLCFLKDVYYLYEIGNFLIRSHKVTETLLKVPLNTITLTPRNHITDIKNSILNQTCSYKY